MPVALDQQMETASRALAELDYARCEALCADALVQARVAQDWVLYQRECTQSNCQCQPLSQPNQYGCCQQPVAQRNLLLLLCQ